MKETKTSNGINVIINGSGYDWNYKPPTDMDEWEYYEQQLKLVDLDKPDFINENGYRFYNVPNSDGTLYCPDNGQGFIPPAKGSWDCRRDFVRDIINERYDHNIPVVKRLRMLIDNFKSQEQTQLIEAEIRFLEDLISREGGESMMETNYNELDGSAVDPGYGAVIITEDGVEIVGGTIAYNGDINMASGKIIKENPAEAGLRSNFCLFDCPLIELVEVIL